LPTFAITHGDDVDGLTCGAFLKRLKDCDVYLANYDNLEYALDKVQPPIDVLYICDLNIREALEPELLRVMEFAEINIIDHHQMDPELRNRLQERGINVTLETTDCAGVLCYNLFSEELGIEATRIAAYAAISDMFENGPLASGLLSHMDRKFIQHEAQILTHALAADQTLDFKRQVMEDLSKYEYPHRIEGAVERAVKCLEDMAKLKEGIPERAIIVGRVAYIEAFEESTGLLSNLIIDTLGVDVGVSYKPNGDYANVSLRGEKGLEEHLGEISKRLAKNYEGFGGGHKRASGAKIPLENVLSFIMDIAGELNR